MAKNTKNRWRHPKLKGVFVFERYGNCYASIDSKRIAMNLKFIPENRLLAINKATELYALHSQSFDDMSLTTALELFLKHHVSNLSTHTQKTYKYVLKFYFTDLKLLIKDTNQIRQMIYNNLKKESISPNGIRAKMLKVHAFFNYLVKEGYINKNPIPKSWTPINETKEKEIFTKEEMIKIFKHLESDFVLNSGFGKKYKMVYYYIKIAYITAMRIDEIAKMSWGDIGEKMLTIHGKGNRKRNFPIFLFPELHLILQKMADEYGKTGRLFKWQSTQSPRYLFSKVLDYLNIPHEQRSFHEIRKTTINNWREKGISFEVRTKLAGHSLVIAEKNYTLIPDELFFAKNLTEIISELN